MADRYRLEMFAAITIASGWVGPATGRVCGPRCSRRAGRRRSRRSCRAGGPGPSRSQRRPPPRWPLRARRHPLDPRRHRHPRRPPRPRDRPRPSATGAGGPAGAGCRRGTRRRWRGGGGGSPPPGVSHHDSSAPEAGVAGGAAGVGSSSRPGGSALVGSDVLHVPRLRPAGRGSLRQACSGPNLNASREPAGRCLHAAGAGGGRGRPASGRARAGADLAQTTSRRRPVATS